MDTEFGRWMEDVTNEKLSNIREVANLVIRLKMIVECGRIQKRTEVFICTDNQVAKSIYFKGLIKSCELHEIIVRLRKLEMEGRLIVHFLWISGKWMIEKRTDGLSHGEFASGIMQRNWFLGYLLLNKITLCQQPGRIRYIIRRNIIYKKTHKTFVQLGLYNEPI